MKRYQFFLLLIVQSVSIFFCNYCFLRGENCIINEAIGQIGLAFFTLFWNVKLVIIFSGRSDEFIEPQAYLFVLIFVTNILKHVLTLYIIYGLGNDICPFKIEQYVHNNSVVFRTVFRHNPSTFIPYVMANIVHAVTDWCLTVVCAFRLYLSFQQVRQIKFSTKLAIILPVIVLPTSLVIVLNVNYKNPASLGVLVTFVSSFLVIFFILVVYSNRNRVDEASNLQYFTLWVVFILFLACNTVMYVTYFECYDGFDTDSNGLIKAGLQSNLASNAIIPVAIMLADKTLRKLLLTSTGGVAANEPLLANNESRYGAIGTVVEDPRFGAQKGTERREFPVDDPRYAPQLFESVFPEDNVFQAPCKKEDDANVSTGK